MPVGLGSFRQHFPAWHVLVIDNNPVPGEATWKEDHDAERQWIRSQPGVIVVSNPGPQRTHGAAVDVAVEWCRRSGVELLLHLEPDCLISGVRWYENLQRGIDSGAWMAGSHRKEYGPIHPTPSLWRVSQIRSSFDYADRIPDERHPRFGELFNREWLLNAVAEANQDTEFWLTKWDSGQRPWFDCAVEDKAILVADTDDFEHFWFGSDSGLSELQFLKRADLQQWSATSKICFRPSDAVVPVDRFVNRQKPFTSQSHRKRPIKIIATLLVRDEAELVADCFEHHLSQGVDGFLVTGHSSIGNLADILHEYRDVILDRYCDADCRDLQGQWRTRMARRAADFGPDWILHLDADERWYGLQMLEHIPAEYTQVKTGFRRNHLPVASSMPCPFDPGMMPYFEISGRTGLHRPRFDSFASEWHGKILHRPLPDVRAGIGNDSMNSPAVAWMRCDDITVHHYPIRSLEQFRRKVLSRAASVETRAWSADIPPQWGKWRDLNNQGRLPEVFQSFCLTESEIQNRLADGTLHYLKT